MNMIWGDNIPYLTFENLEESKKQKIINAGFKVFAEYGYAKASVDEIVKEAEISKGSLFYYFGTKQNFYIYLYEYCGELMEKVVDTPGPDGRPTYMQFTDFFDRLNAIALLKSKCNYLYPHMSNFAKKAVFDTSPAISERISAVNNKYTRERAMLFFQGLDYSKFKDGIDPMMVIQLITWTSEGCVKQVQQKELLKGNKNPAPDFNEVTQLYYTYVEMYRKQFYKEEFL